MANKRKGENNSSDDEIRYYLEAYGIHSLSEETAITPEDMVKSGYTEISNSYAGQIGMMFQQLPGLAAHAMSHNGTYRVYFDKSLGVLQQATQGDGFFRANVVQAGVNNKITGQALLKTASAGPLVANAVFSALSMVTGQYFLSEINGKLSSIDKKVDGIRQFLEMEKNSKLWANKENLKQINHNLNLIQENEHLKQTTIIQLQQIRNDSLANTEFYSKSIQVKKEELKQLKKNGKAKEIYAAINDFKNSFSCYGQALQNYCWAYYLETVLSGIMDEHYLHSVIGDIGTRVDRYEKDIGTIKNEINTVIAEAKAYKPDEFSELITKAVTDDANMALLGSLFPGYPIIKKVNEIRDAAKVKAKEEAIVQSESLLQQYNTCEFFDQISKSLTKYDQVINRSKIELVCTGGRTYIKFIDAEFEDNKLATEN